MFAGFFQVHAVSSAVRAQTGSGWGYVWAAMIALGGLSALYGAVRDHWTGELVGLPLLGFSCLVYSVSVLLASGGRDASLAPGLLLLGVSMWIAARWALVCEEMKLAQLAHEIGASDER
jgi:hypothetical protein